MKYKRSFFGDSNLLFISAMPFILWLFGNRDWMFDPPGYLDSFTYLTYFRHLTEPIYFFAFDYKASRLPWILPGWLCFRLFGEAVGSTVLHLFVQIFGLIGFYLGVRESFGTRTVALSAAIALSVYPLFHGLGGWNYHMGITIAYELWAMYFVILAAKQDPRWLAASGAAFAMGVHTHLFLVAFAPILWMYYRGHGAREKSRAVYDLSLFIGGGVGVTFLFSLINFLLGNPFLFFWNQIRYTLGMFHLHSMYKPLPEWLPFARYLVVPGLSAIASIALLFFGKQARNIGFAWMFSLAVSFFFQCVVRVPTLNPDYHTGVLVAPSLYALVAFCCVAFPACHRPTYRLVGLALLIFIVPVLCPHPFSTFESRIVSIPRMPWGVWVFVVLVLAVGTLSIRKSSWAPGLFMFLIALAIKGNHLMSYNTRDYYGLSHFRDLNAASLELEEFLARYDPYYGLTKFWFDDTECVKTPEGAVSLEKSYDSLIATRYWANSLLGDPNRHGISRLESLTEKDIQDIGYVGVFARNENRQRYKDQLRKRLAALDYDPRFEDAFEFSIGGTKLSFELFKVYKLESSRVDNKSVLNIRTDRPLIRLVNFRR